MFKQTKFIWIHPESKNAASNNKDQVEMYKERMRLMIVSTDIKCTSKYFRAWIMSCNKFIRLKEDINNNLICIIHKYIKRINAAGDCGFCIEYDSPHILDDCAKPCPASEVCLKDKWKHKLNRIRAIDSNIYFRLQTKESIEALKEAALDFCDWCLDELYSASPVVSSKG